MTDKISESTVIFAKEPFSLLSEADRKLFVDSLRFFTFSAGEILIRMGEMGSVVYFLTEGECGVFLPPPAPQEPVAKLLPGDFFGEMSVLANVKRTATVKTLTEVRVAAMDSRKFKKLFMANPDIVGGLDSYYKKRRGELTLFTKRQAEAEKLPEPGLLQKLKKALGL